MNQPQTLLRRMFLRPAPQAKITWRNRLLWQSACGELTLRCQARNASEGVPYSALIQRHPPNPRTAPSAGVRQRLNMANDAFGQCVMIKDSLYGGFDHFLIVTVSRSRRRASA